MPSNQHLNVKCCSSKLKKGLIVNYYNYAKVGFPADFERENLLAILPNFLRVAVKEKVKKIII